MKNKLKEYSPVALSLFSAAWCNLKCSYCYIPKTNPKFLLKYHTKILDEVKNHPERLIERIKQFYFDPNDLQYLSHWGTEPTLTFYEYKNFYKLALKEFPNIKEIQFSSNFTTNIEKTVEMLKFIQDLKPEIEFDIQMSLDGPHWITDINRGSNLTNLIVENIYKFYELTKQYNIKNIKTHFKPTIAPENFDDYLENNRLYEYYQFFDNILINLYKYPHIQTSNFVGFTLVTFTEYTKEHGIKFNKIFEIIENLPKKDFKIVNLEFSYYDAFKRLMEYYREYKTDHRMFTCSADDSQYGLGISGLHSCHDSYYFNLDGYEKVLGISKEEQDIIAKRLITEDPKDFDMRLYVNRGYHDFTKLKENFAIGQILFLAKIGEINKIYLNYDMTRLLAKFVISRMFCHVHSYINYKTVFLNPFDYYRLFGNGLLENFIKKYVKRGID